MATGTKPSTIVVRTFRGQQLYLRSVHSGNGMHWTNDRARALKLGMDDALAVSERASREWGTQCAVEDSTGTLARDANSDAAANALSIFRQFTVNGRVDHKALLDEMQSRNGGKTLAKAQQRTLAKMVRVYEDSLS